MLLAHKEQQDMLTGMTVDQIHDELLCLGAAWLPFNSNIRSHTPLQKSEDQENLPHGFKTTVAEKTASLSNKPCCQEWLE